MAQIRYTRNLFLRAMSVIYLFAFTSFYIQIPGLYGDKGILPAKTQLDSKATTLTARIHNKPTLLWLAPYVGLDTEYMMDVLALLGIFLAFTGFISQKFCTTPMFAGLWSLYYSLYQVGQTFMWFQWDILLLEAGFLSILVAPLRYRPVSRRKPLPLSPSDSISFWLVRWLLFRLMFSSGVVKLTSGCPTWWGLTALTVHFESQCLPTALAWYSHHLPEWFLKLTTVHANIAELVVPLLFFVPLRPVCSVAFYFQAFLQICIILTGNYNFFNFLTLTLCLSLLDDDFFLKKKPQKGKSGLVNIIGKIITWAIYLAILYGTIKYYNLRLTPNYTIDSKIAFSRQEFDYALAKTLPVAVYLGLASLSFIIVKAVATAIVDTVGTFAKVRTVLSTLFYAGAAIFIFGLSIIPFSTLHPTGNSTVVPAFRMWHSRLDHLHLVNSYGLFRRMTGVGGRPEVIIEGSNHIDGPWQEYHFLYKPGNVNATPPFVAPHQPRLDWQMWFAALGTYHQNPWIMSLAYRLLNGQQEVLQLMDLTKNPFPNKPPKYVKASLYHYHYTPWSQRWSSSWWTREKQSEYFPIFSKDHPPLVDYLRNLKIISDKPKEIRTVKPMWKLVLDRLRFFASQVEPSILLWSVFTAGLAIIVTANRRSLANMDQDGSDNECIEDIDSHDKVIPNSGGGANRSLNSQPFTLSSSPRKASTYQQSETKDVPSSSPCLNSHDCLQLNNTGREGSPETYHHSETTDVSGSSPCLNSHDCPQLKNTGREGSPETYHHSETTDVPGSSPCLNSHDCVELNTGRDGLPENYHHIETTDVPVSSPCLNSHDCVELNIGREGRPKTTVSEMDSLIRTDVTQHTTTLSQIPESDDFIQFFLSMAKSVKKLSRQEQIKVKIEVMNAVFQAELREAQRTENLVTLHELQHLPSERTENLASVQELQLSPSAPPDINFSSETTLSVVSSVKRHNYDVPSYMLL